MALHATLRIAAVAMVVAAVVGALPVQQPAITDDLVARINAQQTTWTAGHK